MTLTCLSSSSSSSLPAQDSQQLRQKRSKWQWVLLAFIIMALIQLLGMTPILYHLSFQYLSSVSTTTSLDSDLQMLLQRDENESHTNSNDKVQNNSSEQPSTIPTIHTDIHYQSMAMLNLLDWEVQSVQGIQHKNATYQDGVKSCRPPKGIMPQCCLGCYSMGGDISFGKRKSCAGRSLQDYHVVRDHALQVLEASSHLLIPKDVACDVCRIIEVAQTHNLTIGIFGDSMTFQIVQGLICEMQRRNYHVTVDQQVHGGNDCMACIRSITHIHIRSPMWSDSDPPVYMKFMFQYRYPFKNATEEHYVATSSDVLVINFGLHWGYTLRHIYQQVMDEFLKYLKDNGTFQLLAHRETSAQHFDANGGDYSLRTRKEPTMCVPMTWNGSTAGWREDKVQTSARKQGYTVITADHTMGPINSSMNMSSRDDLFILPYFNFTAAHHTMHPMTNAEMTAEDCSHYCGSPFVYQPIWRSLRLAMDRRFESILAP